MELRALLQEPLGAAAAGHAAAEAASVAGPSGAAALGSISRLSPVRASKKVQGCLGADGGQVRGGSEHLCANLIGPCLVPGFTY